MPKGKKKINWRKFLTDERLRLKLKKDNPRDYRQMMFQIRKRVKANMEEIGFIFESLKNTPNPEKEYYLIFKDAQDLPYIAKKEFVEAWFKGEAYKDKLLPVGAPVMLSAKLTVAGIEHDFKKLCRSRSYRVEMMEKLMAIRKDDSAKR